MLQRTSRRKKLRHTPGSICLDCKDCIVVVRVWNDDHNVCGVGIFKEGQVVGCPALVGVLTEEGTQSIGLLEPLNVRTISSDMAVKFSSKAFFFFNLRRHEIQMRVRSSINIFNWSFLTSVSTGNKECPRTLILDVLWSSCVVHKAQNTYCMRTLPWLLAAILFTTWNLCKLA